MHISPLICLPRIHPGALWTQANYWGLQHPHPGGAQPSFLLSEWTLFHQQLCSFISKLGPDCFWAEGHKSLYLQFSFTMTHWPCFRFVLLLLRELFIKRCSCTSAHQQWTTAKSRSCFINRKTEEEKWPAKIRYQNRINQTLAWFPNSSVTRYIPLLPANFPGVLSNIKISVFNRRKSFEPESEEACLSRVMIAWCSFPPSPIQKETVNGIPASFLRQLQTTERSPEIAFILTTSIKISPIFFSEL